VGVLDWRDGILGTVSQIVKRTKLESQKAEWRALTPHCSSQKNMSGREPTHRGPCSGTHQRAAERLLLGSNVVGGEGRRNGLGGPLQEGIFGMQILTLSFSSFFLH
jgi:hypothetical protein